MAASRRPLIIGEVLFDQFPDGRKILGGAPFNVAWNLQGLGLQPLFLSAVGSDEEGRLVRKEMADWNMDLSGLQTITDFPTGKVRIEFDAGDPQYEIVDQQAYDHVHDPSCEVSAEHFSLLYVGSLAARNEPTRRTIRRLIATPGLPRFVDINVRQPWFDRDFAAELLTEAQWVKVNQDELSLLSDEPCKNEQQVRHAAARMCERFLLQELFITCGAQGAFAVDPRGRIEFCASPPPTPMTDAVGAGDAFAAAMIYGITRAFAPQTNLRSAVRFASQTCTLRGATTKNKAHYLLPQQQLASDVP